MKTTYDEIHGVEQTLVALAGRGCKDDEVCKKTGRHLVWCRTRLEEFKEAQKALLLGHAKKENGQPVPVRKKNEETGEWENHRGLVMEDPNLYDEALERLLQTEINTNGIKFTDEDLAKFSGVMEPSIRVGLGCFYDWGEEEE